MALTVRGTGKAVYGTRGNPTPVPINLTVVDPPPVTLHQVLGYEGIPATQVYGFTAPRHLELRLSRRSEDRIERSIAVVCLGAASGERWIDINRASGVSDWTELPAGEYRIVCSLGVAEQVELELQLAARPYRQRLGALRAGGEGFGVASLGGGLRGIATGGSPSVGLVLPVQLQASGSGSGGGVLELLALTSASSRCSCVAQAAGGGSAAVAPMVWVDQDGRPMGRDVTLAMVELADVAIVRGSDWSTAVDFRDASSGAPRDLSGLAFGAAIWDSHRALLRATPSCVVDGSVVTVALTAEQTQVMDCPDGTPLLYELWAEDDSGHRAYLQRAEGVLRWGFSEPL